MGIKLNRVYGQIKTISGEKYWTYLDEIVFYESCLPHHVTFVIKGTQFKNDCSKEEAKRIIDVIQLQNISGPSGGPK